MDYPKVQHKIPELFQLIIASDNLLSLLKQVPVIDFSQFKKVRQERRDYLKAAENFIIRQKGGKA